MIYLDHAATSFPKPQVVLDSVQHWYRNVGVSADRGDGPRTREAASVVQQVRQGIATCTGHQANRIAFCSGATEGLNLALRATLPAGHRVLTTAFEHSSVVRPLLALRDERKLRIDVIAQPASAIDEALCSAIAQHQPDVLVFTHASNVTGAVFDAARICATAKRHGTMTILDASQTIGYLPVAVGADIVIGSCHKAMHGPPGLGFVSIDQQLTLPPQKFGGTGSSAALERHPTQWPQAFEAGTPNMPALFGMAAALEWLRQHQPSKLLASALRGLDTIESALRGMTGFQVVAAETSSRVPVMSFVHEAYDPVEIGSILAASDIQARSGFHCAPWVHAQLGTSIGGTVRIATGPQTSDQDITSLLGVLASL